MRYKSIGIVNFMIEFFFDDHGSQTFFAHNPQNAGSSELFTCTQAPNQTTQTFFRLKMIQEPHTEEKTGDH